MPLYALVCSSRGRCPMTAGVAMYFAAAPDTTFVRRAYRLLASYQDEWERKVGPAR